MAESWKKPAWEIDDSIPALIWYIRAQYVWNLKAEIEQKKYEEAKRGGWRK